MALSVVVNRCMVLESFRMHSLPCLALMGYASKIVPTRATLREDRQEIVLFLEATIERQRRMIFGYSAAE